MLSLTTIASELSDSESLTASYPTPLSTAISEHSLVRDVQNFIEALRMSSAEDSPVSRFPTQVNDLAPTTLATCGPQLSNASASYDPATRCWRMCQGWLLADISAPSWETWPKAGFVFATEFYPQPNWERRISEIGSGLLPTPTDVSKGGGSSRSGDRIDEVPTLQGMARKGLWPRPTTRDWRSGHASEETHSKNSRPLSEVVTKREMWRSPSASVIEPKSNVIKLTGRTPQDPQVGLADQVGGQLNPDWVEWLMGWPIGWTSLEPLSPEAFATWLDGVTTGTWWPNEPDIPRVAKGVPNRTDRLKAIGNGQASPVVAAAWQMLAEGLCNL